MVARPITLAVARRWLKPRPKNAHKGTSGRVLVVAGSRGMVGAGVLCAGGAVRAGAGLVKLATVASQQVAAAKRAPLEVTTAGLPEDRSGHLGSNAWGVLNKLILSWRPDVVAVGPGLGTTGSVGVILKHLLAGSTRLVVDADGLNLLAAMKLKNKPSAPLILTPHLGELRRLGGDAKSVALRFGGVCLLKGPGTLVTDGRSAYQNSTGNPAMASGGMGDVLTGIIAATWAQQDDALTSAAFGVFVHGLAADLAVKKYPERTLLASDVVDFLPQAFKKIWRNK